MVVQFGLAVVDEGRRVRLCGGVVSKEVAAEDDEDGVEGRFLGEEPLAEREASDQAEDLAAKVSAEGLRADAGEGVGEGPGDGDGWVGEGGGGGEPVARGDEEADGHRNVGLGANGAEDGREEANRGDDLREEFAVGVAILAVKLAVSLHKHGVGDVGAHDAAAELADEVGQQALDGEFSLEEERHGDDGIEVRSRDGAEDGDQNEEDAPRGQGVAQKRDAVVGRQVVAHHPTSNDGGHEVECPKKFGGALSPKAGHGSRASRREACCGPGAARGATSLGGSAWVGCRPFWRPLDSNNA
mmetsp:Transcript_14420/g.45455  ORF Transcript_14420/g.45455 Transcript_14420/m.45455 type:complete len:299 (-) Transcript_14420:25-921(-)